MDEFTRNMQQVDVIYVGRMLEDREGVETVFVSPDGEGRYYYDSVEAAREDQGDLRVIHLHDVVVTDW